MLLNQRRVVLATLILCLSLGSLAECQVLPFRNKTEEATGHGLTQSRGPWLIFCASFEGEIAKQQADQLANELNGVLNEYDLRAYVYEHVFDHSDKLHGRGWKKPTDEVSGPVAIEWKPSSGEQILQVAVLVGDFPTSDDNRAKQALTAIKQMAPRSLMQSSYASNSQAMAQQVRAQGGTPMAMAFLMPNPLLPEDHFKQVGVDETVENMNRGVKHSLLKCRKAFTVRVATFTGERKFNADASQIQQANYEDEQRRINGDRIANSPLVEAFHKADILCRALRKKGVEAYVFHDRYQSIVCIGSFDWATHELDNGKFEYNPELAEVVNRYKGERKSTPSGVQLVPRTMVEFKNRGMNFDTQPMPIEVPKSRKSKGFRLLGR